jgi:hypothetical protein
MLPGRIRDASETQQRCFKVLNLSNMVLKRCNNDATTMQQLHENEIVGSKVGSKLKPFPLSCML